MKQHGPCIYRDTSTKGKGKNHNCWRADVSIRGVRYRKRSKDQGVLVAWINSMLGLQYSYLNN